MGKSSGKPSPNGSILCLAALLLMVPTISGRADAVFSQQESTQPSAAHLWPRIIVDIFPPSDSGKAGQDLVEVRLELPSGQVLTGHVRGCPEIAGVLCTYSFFTAPRDKHANLIFRSRKTGLTIGQLPLRLDNFSYEGEDIRYVRARVAADGALTIEEPKLISPGA